MYNSSENRNLQNIDNLRQNIDYEKILKMFDVGSCMKHPHETNVQNGNIYAQGLV